MADNVVDIGFRYSKGLNEALKNIQNAINNYANDIQNPKAFDDMARKIEQLTNEWKQFSDKTNASLTEVQSVINKIHLSLDSLKTDFSNFKVNIDLTSAFNQVKQFQDELNKAFAVEVKPQATSKQKKTSSKKSSKVETPVSSSLIENITSLKSRANEVVEIIQNQFSAIKNQNIDIKFNIDKNDDIKTQLDTIFKTIEDFQKRISELPVSKKNSILTQIDAITSKAKELENLAKILSETESKIQLASQAASNEVTNAIVKDETRKQEAYQQTAQIKNKSLTVEFDKTSNSIAEFRESAESIGISPSAVDGIVGQLEKLNLEITKITTNFHKSKDSAEQYIKKLTVSAIDGTHEVKIVQNFDKDQKMIDTDTTVVSKLKEEKRAADDTAKAEDKLADIRKKVLKAQGIGNVANINFDNVENVDLIKAKITELQQLTQNFDATAPLKEQEMAYQQIENIVNELTASVKKYNETNNTKIKVDVDQDSLEQAQRILNKRFEAMEGKFRKIGIKFKDTSNQDLKTAINTFNANKESYDSKNLGKANKALQEMNLEYQKQNNILKENKKTQDQNYESRLAKFKNLLDAINKVNSSLKDESVISNETKLSEQLVKRKELYTELADFLFRNGYESIDAIQAEIKARGDENKILKNQKELLEQLKAIATTKDNKISFLNGQVLSAEELDNLLKNVYKKYNALKSVQNKGTKPMTAEDSRALTSYENIIVAVRNSLMGLKSGEELATNSVFRFTDGTEQAVERVREFIKDIDNLNAKFAITGKAPKGNVISSEITNINDFKAMARKDANFKGTVKGNSNPKIQELGNGLYQIDYEIIDTEKNIKKLSYQWNESMKSMAVSTNTVTSTSRGLGAVIDSVKKKIGQLATYWTAMYLNPYMMVGEIRQAVSQVVELDTALVDLRKTANMSTQELNAFYDSSNDIAKQMGVTTKEIIQQAADWSRLSYNTAETATQMAKLSSEFALISPGMDVSQATSGLVSIMKAYDVGVSEVLDGIESKVNIIGNNLAISNANIVDMLQNSVSAMAEGNNSLEQTIALESAAYEIVQDNSVGNGFRTVSMRLRGINEETEELDEGLTNIKGDLYDLTGISIMEDADTYKSTYQILKEISEVWNDLSDKKQAKALELMFGKTRAEICPYVQKCA